MPSIGIDLGGTKIEGAILDEQGRIVARDRIPTEQEGGYEHILGRVASLAGELRARADGVERIGIGTPGSISARDGTLKNSNTLCLNGKRLREDLEARLGLPLVLENDANCFALAEARLGSGRGGEVVFGVILGTGVGGGIVLNGRIWAGPQHIAGEWGHHSVDPDGPACYCGQRGCVETLLSGPAMEADYQETTGGFAAAAQVAAQAARGEAAAVAVLDRYLGRFGRALANLIAILDPSVVVLGGGLSNLDVLYDRGRDEVARRIFNDELRTPIRRNSLGDSAGVIGAALLATSTGMSTSTT
ncbi:MAG: ROK family protein [Deltaproteobacteria bacterium]|nr:ROK family protein [Deltaproteobacteria bacterium]